MSHCQEHVYMQVRKIKVFRATSLLYQHHGMRDWFCNYIKGTWVIAMCYPGRMAMLVKWQQSSWQIFPCCILVPVLLLGTFSQRALQLQTIEMDSSCLKKKEICCQGMGEFIELTRSLDKQDQELRHFWRGLGCRSGEKNKIVLFGNCTGMHAFQPFAFWGSLYSRFKSQQDNM